MLREARIAMDNEGKREDVFAVLESLADGDYGSVAQAICVLVRQAPLFKETWAKLQKERANTESVTAASQ